VCGERERERTKKREKAYFRLRESDLKWFSPFHQEPPVEFLPLTRKQDRRKKGLNEKKWKKKNFFFFA